MGHTGLMKFSVPSPGRQPELEGSAEPGAGILNRSGSSPSGRLCSRVRPLQRRRQRADELTVRAFLADAGGIASSPSGRLNRFDQETKGRQIDRFGKVGSHFDVLTLLIETFQRHPGNKDQFGLQGRSQEIFCNPNSVAGTVQNPIANYHIRPEVRTQRDGIAAGGGALNPVPKPLQKRDKSGTRIAIVLHNEDFLRHAASP
jgi:protein involved in polysaccharide export with SLBB domain